MEMARIVQAADFKDLLDTHSAARGLALISYGFPLVTGDDHVTLDKASFLYDALYASISEASKKASETTAAHHSSGAGTDSSAIVIVEDQRARETAEEKSAPGTGGVKNKISLAEALALLPGPNGERFISVFERGSLIVEVLQPPSPVPLPAHTQDEAYVVLHGSGELLNAGVRQRIGPGDFLFVAAGVEHHFENFTDDLTIWVIFSDRKVGNLSPQFPIASNQEYHKGGGNHELAGSRQGRYDYLQGRRKS